MSKQPDTTAPASSDNAPPLTCDRCENISQARMNNAIVAYILLAGGSMEDCVVALVNQQAALSQRILQLEYIRPRKIKVGDKVMVWRCPVELIPEEGT